MTEHLTDGEAPLPTGPPLPSGESVAVLGGIVGSELGLLRAAMEAIDEAIVVTGPELNQPGPRIEYVNAGFTRMTGYTAVEVVGRTPRMFQGPDTNRAMLDRLRTDMEAGRSSRGEAINYRKDGTSFFIEWLIAPVLDEAGCVAHWVSAQRDVTDRKRAETRQGLLLAELNHRVKNTLAAVQSVAAQTARQAESADGFRVAFQSRLLALARSHDMLTKDGWEGTALHEVVQRTLAAYGEAPTRFSVVGPPLQLVPTAVVTLSLAFHELATNAAKHGALSVPGGRVEVAWALEAREVGLVLAISWQESGGPTVRPPERHGFGSRLIERGLPQEFGAEVALNFAPSGVECRICLPSTKNVLI